MLATNLPTRRDILPAEVCDLLEPIQGQTRPHAWAATVDSLMTLRPDWENVLRIDPHSAMLGSGSVAQVYRGKAFLTEREEGGAGGDPTAPPLPREVAVKVIHPDVKRQIELDLELMRLGGACLLVALPAFGCCRRRCRCACLPAGHRHMHPHPHPPTYIQRGWWSCRATCSGGACGSSWRSSPAS